MNHGIVKAVEVIGGNVKMGALLGVHPSFVSHWKNEVRPVPICYLDAIHKATGVSKYEIRPEIYGEDPAKTKPKKRKAA